MHECLVNCSMLQVGLVAFGTPAPVLVGAGTDPSPQSSSLLSAQRKQRKNVKWLPENREIFITPGKSIGNWGKSSQVQVKDFSG